MADVFLSGRTTATARVAGRLTGDVYLGGSVSVGGVGNKPRPVIDNDLLGSENPTARMTGDLVVDIGLAGSENPTARMTGNIAVDMFLTGSQKATGGGRMGLSNIWDPIDLAAVGRAMRDGLVVVTDFQGNILPVAASANAPVGAPPSGRGVVFQDDGSVWVWDGAAWQKAAGGGAEVNDLTAAVVWANVPNANTPDCIHDNVASEITAVTEKNPAANNDELLIEDSAAGNGKKSVKVINLPQFHPNVALQFTALTSKTTPSVSDKIVIESAAHLGAKRQVSLSNLDKAIDHNGTLNYVASQHVASTSAETMTNKNLTSSTNKGLHRLPWALELPTAAEDAPWFRTDRGITVSSVKGVLVGGTSPSVTFVVRHATDRSAAGTLVTVSLALTSTTTGTAATLSDSTIPANSYVWVETTAMSGDPTWMELDMEFTDD